MSARANIKHPVASVHQLFLEAPNNGHDIKRWTHLRLWAAKNAYTLTFLSACFVITWAVQIVSAVIK